MRSTARRVVVLTAALFGITAATASTNILWLETLPLDTVVQGWGKARAGKSVQDKPLTIGGRVFERGIGTHASSRIVLDLKGHGRRFKAFVGVDDEVKGQPASIEFVVMGDRRELWRSGVMKAGDAAQEINLNIRDHQRLELIVTDARDGTTHDHADWAEANIDYGGEAPTMALPVRRPPYILTPKASARPRINGATVFGVRPNHPFLFTIPATGTRPLTFGVRNLPPGLAVDTQSGQITGTLTQAGTHEVFLVASNALAQVERPFRIVCGETLALTPHMGWNSWYVWENHVTDQIMRGAADAMVATGLKDHGFMYVNIDDCWSVKPGSTDPTLQGEPRDASGRVNSNPRFPDMKALTDYIHARGLKAGIYTSPGPLTCAGHVGAYQHEEQDAARFAEWGFDFLKYDWCSYGEIARNPDLAALQRPYRLMGDILRKQDRDLVLNLCQYGMGSVWKWGKEVGGHSWRTAGDLGLSFEGIPEALFRDAFGLYAAEELHNYGGPGGWNDPDYLLLGYLSNWRGSTAPTPLTTDEQYSHVTLWCLLAAPLILSGDITRLDDFTLSLLSNDEILAVDQDPLGKPAQRILLAPGIEIWARDLADGTKAVGLFNRDAYDSVDIELPWSALGLKGTRTVRDLWRQSDLGPFRDSIRTPVPPHGVVALQVR